jgi:dihydroneopterin triphosphate diphosphatase
MGKRMRDCAEGIFMRVRYDMVQCHVVRPAGNSWEFLQLQRAPGDYMSGTWQVVHGTSEGNETAWQAALRELREETSLIPVEFYKLDLVDTFYIAGIDTMYHCPVFCAIVSPDAAVRLNEEHTDFRWIERSCIDRQFMWPSDRRAVIEIGREILDDGPAKAYLRITI